VCSSYRSRYRGTQTVGHKVGTDPLLSNADLILLMFAVVMMECTDSRVEYSARPVRRQAQRCETKAGGRGYQTRMAAVLEEHAK
jgi:hypothetical protein